MSPSKCKKRGELWAWVYCSLFGIPDEENDAELNQNEATDMPDSQNESGGSEEN